MKTKRIPFIKMHGAGNDFVFVTRETTETEVSKPLAQHLLDRRYGVGGDQLLELIPGTSTNPPHLKIWNPDGSIAEMCGNGVRAVAHYLQEFKGVNKDFTMMTDSGPKEIHFSDGKIEVDMGEPILEGKKIPTKYQGDVINHSLKVKGKTFKIHALSMGNPHCVIFVENVKSFPVEKFGPLIEHHSFFPKRVNVEFAQVAKKEHVSARVWERGTGETLACGTGACAIAVAGVRVGLTGHEITVDLPGGQLGVRWANNNHVYLTGPAEVTFSGNYLID